MDSRVVYEVLETFTIILSVHYTDTVMNVNSFCLLFILKNRLSSLYQLNYDATFQNNRSPWLISSAPFSCLLIQSASPTSCRLFVP